MLNDITLANCLGCQERLKQKTYNSFIFESYWRASNWEPSGAKPAISVFRQHIQHAGSLWLKKCNKDVWKQAQTKSYDH